MPKVQLPETVTPQQFQQIAPVLIRAILAEGGGWGGRTDKLTFAIANNEITGQFRDGKGLYQYRIGQERGQWFREFWPVAGVQDIPPQTPQRGLQFAAPEPPEPTLADLYAKQLREQAGGVITGWTDQIRELLDDSEDLPEFAAKLYGLYPDLQGEELAAVMEQAMLAGGWAGAYEAQDNG